MDGLNHQQVNQQKEINDHEENQFHVILQNARYAWLDNKTSGKGEVFL